MVASCDRSLYDSGESGIHGATGTMGSEVSLQQFYGTSAHETLKSIRTELQTEHSTRREAVEKCLQALRSVVVGYGYLAGVALMKAHFEYLVRMESQDSHANDGVAIWCSRSAADMESAYRDAVDEDYGIEQHIRIDECSEALQRVFNRFPDVADIALILVHFECLADAEQNTVSGERVALAS